jgi:uncharacterized membrane protein
MRRRSAILLMSGAVAVAGVLVPSIQTRKVVGDTRITGVVVNGGQPIVLGPSAQAAITFSVTASDPSGIRSVHPVGLWGPNYGVLKASATRCAARSRTTSVCTGSASVSSAGRELFNDNAGWWHVQAQANAENGDHIEVDDAGTFAVQHQTETVITGVPATARRGTEITVGGQLDAADWQTHQFTGASGQVLELRFRPAGSSAYQTVVQVANASDGSVQATVRVTQTGTYAWFFTGTRLAAPSQSTDAQVAVS